MAKLGKREIVVENKIDPTIKFRFEVEINVSKKGEFYFTLSDEQKETLLNSGVNLNDTVNHKTKKIGTFYSDTLEKLLSEFEEILKEAVSAEVIEDKFVILYYIKTGCKYCLASGEPVPNGYYVPIEETIDGKYVNWVEGTINGEDGFGFSAYAKIYKKQVLRFKSGQAKTFFYVIRHEQKKELGDYGKKLSDFIIPGQDIRDAYRKPHNWSMGEKKEIAYTEENAKFFYEVLIAVCRMNEQIKGFIKEPEKLQMLINSQVKLIQ